MEKRLWGGFSHQALADLEKVRRSRSESPRDRSDAGLALARWHATAGDYEKALERILYSRSVRPEIEGTNRAILIEVKCLLELGHVDEARRVAETRLSRYPDDETYQLLMANVIQAAGGPDAERLSLVNKPLRAAGLLPLERADPGRPLLIDNLVVTDVPVPGHMNGAKVSILVPAYNAAATLPFALESILAQSWSNLEVIVVDDASTDATWQVVEDFTMRDERVTGLRHETNRGAYAARNTALTRANGDFITVHDSDDWSHPQKLERQISALRRKKAVGVMSSWARISGSLEFVGSWRAGSSFVSLDSSSLLLTRDAIERLGAWDEVRVGADSELLTRAKQLFGTDAIVRTLESLPLAFGLAAGTSLTKAAKTHASTLNFGLRKEYQASARFWRNAQLAADLRLEAGAPTRKFPAPASNLSTLPDWIQYDVVLVSDFGLVGGSASSAYNLLKAFHHLGLRTGIFHWRRGDLGVEGDIRPRFRQLAMDGVIDILVPSDRVRANILMVYYPPILQHRIDALPEGDWDHVMVLVNQMPHRLATGGSKAYDVDTAAETLKKVAGSAGVWFPISPHVRRLMEEDGSFPEIGPTDWLPLIETELWCSRPLTWRGGERERPAVGRHGRDHWTKWPADAEVLSQAYGVDQPLDVRILGGAAQARKILGRKPPNWTVHPFDSLDVREFLSELDFFVHYTHDDYIEEFGRCAAEAMALGIPAILPPRFEENFEGAAVFAEAQQVAEVIDGLWRNEQAYLEQARRGRAFVEEQCGYSAVERRLAPYLPAKFTTQLAAE